MQGAGEYLADLTDNAMQKRDIMTEQTKQTEERRNRNKELTQRIQRMLKQRNQLLQLLLEISRQDATPSAGGFEEFLQILVDYIAAGYFNLYERISEGRERRRAVADLAVKVYPRIEQSTKVALAFEEKYNPDKTGADFSRLDTDLSDLGEALTTRMEFEDQLIELLLI